MKIEHRGTTIEMADDDPRARAVEALLSAFAALSVAPEPQAPLPDEPVDWLSVEPWLAFWRELRPAAREWLTVLLTKSPVAMTDVRQHVRVKKGGLPGLHSHIANAARRQGLEHPITARGYGRDRRYSLAEDAVEPLSKYANLKAPG